MEANSHCIFYTDDDVEDQEIFRAALAEVNSEMVLTTTGNGQELLKALNDPPPVPQIIFLDLNMPKINGFEALRQIRAKEELRHYPVVIFTTADDQKTADKARALGADMFVPKPTSFDALKKAIATCINRDWSTDEDNNYFVQFK